MSRPGAWYLPGVAASALLSFAAGAELGATAEGSMTAIGFAFLGTVLAATGLRRAWRARALREAEQNEEIAASRSALEELRHSEDQIQRAVNEAPLPIAIHTEDGEILLISKEWLRQSGYARKELSTMHEWRAKAYGVGAAEVTSFVQSLFDEERGGQRELVIRTGTGEVRIWNFATSAPGRLWDGRRFFAVIAIDVTEARQAEEKLFENQEHLRLALDSAELGVWDLNPVTGTVSWSERGRAMFGLTAEEVVSYEIFLSRVHPDDRERVHQAALYSFDPKGTGEYGLDYRARWPDGTVRWITAKGRSFFAGDGENRRPVRFIGTCVDITDRKPRALPRQRFAPVERPQAAHEPPEEAVVEPPPAPEPRLHLLLVERSLRLVPLLVERGYRVATVETVAEARAAVAAALPDEDFDLVVCQLGLSDGSGLDLMLELASRYGLKGIALSEPTATDDRRRSFEAGFDRHLLLPVSIQDLDAAIRQVAGALRQ